MIQLIFCKPDIKMIAKVIVSIILDFLKLYLFKNLELLEFHKNLIE